jgi:CRISPR system Cascade subunit CasC
MLIQIHILQNYAPSNLNRDDTGAPKDAVFGGKRRGRISSQCLKRSMRRSAIFEEAFRSSGLLGMRTKMLPTLIEEELKRLGVEQEAIQAIVGRVPEIGRESTKKVTPEEEGEESEAEETKVESAAVTKQLIFIAPNELAVLADSLWEHYKKLGSAKWKSAKISDITKVLKTVLPLSVDIAMFGRMTTSSAFENVEAAVQVAHALSTNALNEEFDYYTAVDDLSGETGAGMIGDVEFNSSTYYKYLNIHWEKLIENLGGDVQVARQAVLALLEAAVTAQPSGKQNSFAAFNLPDFILVEASQRNLPVSYANAFMKPAYASGEHTLMDASVALLVAYVLKTSQVYDLAPERACLALSEVETGGMQREESLASLKKWLAQQLPREG